MSKVITQMYITNLLFLTLQLKRNYNKENKVMK